MRERWRELDEKNLSKFFPSLPHGTCSRQKDKEGRSHVKSTVRERWRELHENNFSKFLLSFPHGTCSWVVLLISAEKVDCDWEYGTCFDRCDHVRNQVLAPLVSRILLMTTAWCGLFGGESKWAIALHSNPGKCRLALILTQEIRALCADSLGKLKSLYAYPMGIHII